MREKAARPTDQQFELIARAIDPKASVIATRELIGGISCRMDVMSYSSESGQHDVVVRQYGPWHKDDDPHPADVEAEVLLHLANNGVSVPGLVLTDEALKILGSRTIVTEYVDGEPCVQPRDSTGWSQQLVDVITQVHRLPVPSRLNQIVPLLFTAMDRSFSRPEPSDDIKSHPLGVELWRKCREMWPSVDKSARNLIHADYWPGNTLWKDDQLVAIVDWEEPRLGEPLWDIAIIVQDSAIFGIDVEDEVIGHYKRISDRSLTDYRFWRMYVAMSEMSDPGEWVEGYRALGGGGITSEEVRANHTNSIVQLLNDG